MTIEQTVEIPPSHRLTIEVPPEIPAGTVLLTFTPKADDTVVKAEYSAPWKKTLTVLKRTQGAWAANPWLTALEDIRADREACAECDPWKDYPAHEDNRGNG